MKCALLVTLTIECSYFSYRDDKEIITSSESDRVTIIRTRADRGCYELIIADVQQTDAGKYSCKAMNIYGDVTSEATVTVVGKFLELSTLLQKLGTVKS